MPVLPDSKDAQIRWFEQRLTRWSAAPTSIGLLATQVTNLNSLVTSARQAFDAAQDARQLSKDSTVDQNTKIEALLDFGSDLIATIKAYAETTNNPSVYVQASVPPPSAPSPTPPPQVPFELQASLDNSGAIRLNWKGSRANGVVFNMWRAIGAGTFINIGETGERTWLDQTIPAGTPEMRYYIQARRGTQISSVSETLSVRYGSLSSSGESSTATEAGDQAGGLSLAA